MNARVGVAICAVLVAAGAAAACTKSDDDNLTREEFIEQMTTGTDGMPVELATCLADGLEDAGIEIDATGEPSEDDKDKATEIATQCFSEATGVDPSDIPGLESTTTAGS